MSVYYTFHPPVPYEQLLQRTKIEVRESSEKIFIGGSKLLFRDGTFIYVFKNERGDAELARFGKNQIEKVFPTLIEEFGVEIYDEYGLKYPDCLS